MYNLIRPYYWLILLFVLGYKMSAQVNPVAQSIKNNRLFFSEGQASKNGVSRISDDPVLRDFGYDDSTLVRLKRQAGVDLARWRDDRPWNEQIKSALSDCIVVGTVVTVEHPQNNAEIHSSYETIAYIQAEEFLRNDFHLTNNLIPVWIQSGNRSQVVGEDTLGIGEHVLLFLSATGLMDYAEVNEPVLYDRLSNTKTVNFCIFNADGKYNVASGKACNSQTGNIRDIDTVKKEIQSIITIVSHLKQ